MSILIMRDLDKHWSKTGYVFILTQALVSWRSILHSIVALSTTKAEYMAMTVAMKETIWLQGLLNDQDLLRIICDSISSIYLIKNLVYYARMKRVDSDFTLFWRFLMKVASS